MVARTGSDKVQNNANQLVSVPEFLSATLSKSLYTDSMIIELTFKLLGPTTLSDLTFNYRNQLLLNFPLYYAAHLGDDISCMVSG